LGGRASALAVERSQHTAFDRRRKSWVRCEASAERCPNGFEAGRSGDGELLRPQRGRAKVNVIHDAERLRAIAAHPAMAKLRSALSSRRPAEAAAEAGVRRAAVALIFRAGRDGSPELLFIKRAEYPGDPWSGQIAFPGGREESGDASLQQTAIRETRGETGIDL